jgi:hypothetical protein
MLGCPVCKNMAGIVNTELTELEVDRLQDNTVVAIVFECNDGHEFTAVYDFRGVRYT